MPAQKNKTKQEMASLHKKGLHGSFKLQKNVEMIVGLLN